MTKIACTLFFSSLTMCMLSATGANNNDTMHIIMFSAGMLQLVVANVFFAIGWFKPT